MTDHKKIVTATLIAFQALTQSGMPALDAQHALEDKAEYGLEWLFNKHSDNAVLVAGELYSDIHAAWKAGA